MPLATIYAAQCGCFASTVGCDRDRLLAECEVITEEDLAHPVGVEVKTLKNRDPNDLPRYKGQRLFFKKDVLAYMRKRMS